MALFSSNINGDTGMTKVKRYGTVCEIRELAKSMTTNCSMFTQFEQDKVKDNWNTEALTRYQDYHIDRIIKEFGELESLMKALKKCD